MLVKKIWILLIMSILTSCCARKNVVVAPEYNVIVEDKTAALREDFNKNIGNKVYFTFDSSALSSEAKNRLESQAQWLLTHPMIMVTIEGHCDERGSCGYNNALGLRRAEAVSKFLITCGVDQARLTTVSYGKDRPEATSRNYDAWALNRRAVSVIIEAS